MKENICFELELERSSRWQQAVGECFWRGDDAQAVGDAKRHRHQRAG